MEVEEHADVGQVEGTENEEIFEEYTEAGEDNDTEFLLEGFIDDENLVEVELEEDAVDYLEEKPKIRVRRCQRRKKVKIACTEDEEGEEELLEGEEEEDEESIDVSTGSSILSAITFEWDGRLYEFDELCDPGTIGNIYGKDVVRGDIIDEIGRKRYEHLCKLLMIPPIQRVLKALETDEIDLSVSSSDPQGPVLMFRGVDGKNLQAMFTALETNKFVRKLILKYNKLSEADCFYLGRTLNVNETITILDLTGCRIDPEGIRCLVEYLTINETLVNLNLSKCNIEDDGMVRLGQVLLRNNSIEQLNLSNNKLNEDAANALAMVLKRNRSIRYLDLSDNRYLCNKCSNKNKRLSFIINAFRLDGPAISEIKKGLGRSRVQIIKLGRNPIPPEDLDALLSSARNSTNLLTLDLEDLWVNKSFLKILNKIKLDRDIEVNVGGVYGNYELKGADYVAVLFKRAYYEADKPKSIKVKRDFGHLIWTLGEEPLSDEDFWAKVKKFKAVVKKEVIDQIVNEFMNQRTKLIDVVAMKKKYLSVFPNSTPPPLPPKEIETQEWTEEVAVEEEIQGQDVVTAIAAYTENEIPDEEVDIELQPLEEPVANLVAKEQEPQAVEET
ncbi:hypothetical protein RUM44_001203 [Polyplax serrata]|uniref:Uncharacterized protein n=1 Tax=Polyplax serrata TaxID=468196 RepID=A0ABR1B6T5_POLSC